MDVKVREQIKAQFPNEKLYPITSPDDGIEIVVKAPDNALFLKYRALSGDFGDAAKRAQADELLVLGSIVYPDRDTFRQDIDTRRLTGFYRSAAAFCAQIAGARENIKMGEEL